MSKPFDKTPIRAVDHLNPPVPLKPAPEAKPKSDHFTRERPSEIVPGAQPQAKPAATPAQGTK